MVIKRDGRREEFNRDKLWASMNSACAKRPLPIGSIDKAIEAIELSLSNAGKAEIPAKAIGELVMETLRAMDRVAYIRFASIYRDFRDIESFKVEIEALLEPRSGEVNKESSAQLSFLEEEGPPRKRRRGRPRKPSNA